MKGYITIAIFVIIAILLLLKLIKVLKKNKHDKLSIAFKVVLILAVMAILAYLITCRPFFHTDEYNDNWKFKISRYPEYYSSKVVTASIYVYEDGRYILYPNTHSQMFVAKNGSFEKDYNFIELLRYFNGYFVDTGKEAAFTKMLESTNVNEEEGFDVTDLTYMEYRVEINGGKVKNIRPEDIANSGDQNLINFFNEVHYLMYNTDFVKIK